MTAHSYATALRCIDCDAAYDLGYRLECAACHGLLELQYDWEALRAAGPAVFEGHGLWRYAPVLPIADPAHRVSLGEGASPLLDCPALGRALGVRRLQVKFEGSNPTGTVKDRSSPTAVAAALQFGFRATSVVSSGNAGSKNGGSPRDSAATWSATTSTPTTSCPRRVMHAAWTAPR